MTLAVGTVWNLRAQVASPANCEAAGAHSRRPELIDWPQPNLKLSIERARLPVAAAWPVVRRRSS
jgi:hypothetical protein